MIRGPVLPHLRESLWSLVSARLDQIETGLTLMLESFDCSDGELGVVEGLARDAAGGVVLVMLAVEGDAMLPARALSSGNFLQRVGDALIRAVPEANFCPGACARVLLVGTEQSSAALRQVCLLPIVGLHACMLEPFRIAGCERFAVRWLATSAGKVGAISGQPAPDREVAVAPSLQRPPSPEFVVPAARAEVWQALLSICERMDRAVLVHGDRFLRSITWNGLLLGEVRTVGGALVASAATGVVRDLRDLRDVHRFADQLLRAYVAHAELDLDSSFGSTTFGSSAFGSSDPAGQALASDTCHFNQPAPAMGSEVDRFSATRHAVGDRSNSSNGESLRSSLAAARLSPEEYSALGDPALVAGSNPGGSVANDRS